MQCSHITGEYCRCGNARQYHKRKRLRGCYHLLHPLEPPLSTISPQEASLPTEVQPTSTTRPMEISLLLQTPMSASSRMNNLCWFLTIFIHLQTISIAVVLKSCPVSVRHSPVHLASSKDYVEKIILVTCKL